jgi:hypothetical protein
MTAVNIQSIFFLKSAYHGQVFEFMLSGKFTEIRVRLTHADLTDSAD